MPNFYRYIRRSITRRGNRDMAKSGIFSILTKLSPYPVSEF